MYLFCRISFRLGSLSVRSFKGFYEKDFKVIMVITERMFVIIIFCFNINFIIAVVIIVIS